MRRVPAIIGSAIFLVIAPGTLAVYVPWYMTQWHFEPALFPIARVIGNSAGPKCHCVKYHGRYTASDPGAITKKIADPMIAGARRMTSV